MSRNKWYVKPIYVMVALALVLSVGIVAFPMSGTIEASPGDIRVPEDYATIQQAIDNVTAANRTILVNATAYNATETVVVDESDIAIRSVNGRAVVTAGGADDHVFNITGQTNVTLEGFTIRDAKGTSKDVAGIYMDNARGCEISDNAVTNITATGFNLAHGICLDHSDHNRFGSNTSVSYINATDRAVGIYLWYSDVNTFNSSTEVSYVNATWAAGIRLEVSKINTFNSNTEVSHINATDWAAGIYLERSHHNTFNSSTSVSYINATDWAGGIYLWVSHYNTFNSGTEVSYVNAIWAAGIRLEASQINTFNSSTEVSHINATVEAYGINLDVSDNNKFNSSSNVSNINATDAYGIYLWFSANNTFSSNTGVCYINATDWAAGIYLERSHINTFNSSTEVSYVNATWAAGIRLEVSKINTFNSSTEVSHINATVEAYGIRLVLYSNNNTFGSSTNVSYVNASYAYGILLIHIDDSSFTNTTVGDVEGDRYAYSVSLHYSNNDTFGPMVIGNVTAVNETAFGVYLNRSRYNEFLECKISDLTAGKETYGVYLGLSDNNTMSDGEIRDNKHGIWVEDSGNNTIRRNMIVNNGGGATGVNVTDGSHENEMEGNCFIENMPQAWDDGSQNVWNGNYWSDYTGPGPYNIGGAANSTDDNPLDECPLTASPAPPPPRVPTVNHWGLIAMIALFAGLLVMRSVQHGRARIAKQ